MAKKTKQAFIVNVSQDFKTIINEFDDTRESAKEGAKTRLTYLYNDSKLQNDNYATSLACTIPSTLATNGELVPSNKVVIVYANSEDHLKQLLGISKPVKS